VINIKNGRVTLLIPASLHLSPGMFSNTGLRAQGRRLSQQRWAGIGKAGGRDHTPRGVGVWAIRTHTNGQGRGAAREEGQQSHTRSRVLQYQEKS
jgi:hypothetical protein